MIDVGLLTKLGCMAAALTTISWLACLVALVPTLAMAMAIKFQEDKESKRALAIVNIVDGESYLRRYRFLFGSMPMAFLLLALVGVPTISCEVLGGCGPHETRTGLFVIGLAVGLFAWSICISLLYNRYFHSHAERPFRNLRGAERSMLFGVKVLSVITLVITIFAATVS